MRVLPDLFTAFRGLCGPLLLWGLLTQGMSMVWFWLFLFAVCTDLIDGWLARRMGGGTEWGKWFDPLADKILTAFTWLGLALIGRSAWWLAVPFIIRDIITGIVVHRASQQGKALPTIRNGQIRAAFEGVALCVLLFHGEWLDVHWKSVGHMIGLIAIGWSFPAIIRAAIAWQPAQETR